MFTITDMQTAYLEATVIECFMGIISREVIILSYSMYQLQLTCGMLLSGLFHYFLFFVCCVISAHLVL